MASTPKPFHLNAERLAHYETEIWRANYARHWLRVAYLVVRLLREEFHLSWWQALRASYYSVRAALAWVPLHHDLDVVRTNPEKVYAIGKASRHAMFDPTQVADRELNYWIVHRESSGKPDKKELIRALAELHAALFGASVEAMMRSAELRAAATTTVDLITSRQSINVDADYARVEEYLREAYHHVNVAMKANV